VSGSLRLVEPAGIEDDGDLRLVHHVLDQADDRPVLLA